ncbi:helix-hairpin-helix domain-containing protein [Winogradskyella sp. 3972H.M.0a.05]|uniref:ComEA family DNA-binding protein n=1 Tax=Winogradskyella sp. 3972H.M.0a.05 TaxID=2950277 RepID=UPI003395A952
MKYHIRSHFRFSNKQRSGIFLLLATIVVLQLTIYVVSNTAEDFEKDNEKLKAFRSEIDSLKTLALQDKAPEIYPFNPNFITDYKGYTLGMTNEEIDRLLEFRKKDQWINSTRQFQQVTKVSDSLLAKISPLFKFPDWVTNPKPKKQYRSYSNDKSKTFEQKKDLNTATAEELKTVNGLGDKLSQRIVKYRKRLGGFSSEEQLNEVYGLSGEVINNIKKDFALKTPKKIVKVDLNVATSEELVKIPHIDYEIAHNIIEQRTLREGYKSLDELTKVKEFPVDKFEIIKLYLKLQQID